MIMRTLFSFHSVNCILSVLSGEIQRYERFFGCVSARYMSYLVLLCDTSERNILCIYTHNGP